MKYGRSHQEIKKSIHDLSHEEKLHILLISSHQCFYQMEKKSSLSTPNRVNL